MREAFWRYFIPHAANGYHPHFLHTKRVAWYGALGVAIKVIVIGAVLFMPQEAWLLPDVLAAEERALAAFINDARESADRSALWRAGALDQSAGGRVAEMTAKQYFSHRGPDNHTLSYFLSRARYPYRVAGENLAVGFPDSLAVLTAWLASPTHYANVMDADWSEAGVGLKSGLFSGEPAVYVAAHFGDPLPLAPPALNSRATLPKVQGEKIDSVRLAEPLFMVGAPTPLQKYVAAERAFTPLFGLFSVARAFYLALIILFAAALLLNIFIEIRRQHAHVIFQTLLLIGVLEGLRYL